jgi:hypothetical protein
LSVNCHRGVITLLCADLKEGNARLCCIPFGLLSDAPRRSSRPVLQLGQSPFVGLIGVTGCGGIWNSELLCQAGRDESKRMTADLLLPSVWAIFGMGHAVRWLPALFAAWCVCSRTVPLSPAGLPRVGNPGKENCPRHSTSIQSRPTHSIHELLS